MKKTLAILATPIIMLSATSAVAGHKLWDSATMAPYVGFEAQWRHMNFDAGRGDNLFNHNSPQGNLFVGLQLNKYLGVEGGYQATSRKTRSTFAEAGDVVAGTTLIAGEAARFDSTMYIHGPHINITGTYPICKDYKLDLIGLVGMARLQAKFTRSATWTSQNGFLPAPATRKFQKKRSVLKLGAGLQHMLTDKWGVRGMVVFENTSRLDAPAVSTNGGIVQPGQFISAKNTVNYSFGTFIKF